ncbi:MAG: hypothetical protein GX437_07270 [Sphingobacteriales bacterium]|nr:hypothetical protein [Sphingobacteriales bacterium]
MDQGKIKHYLENPFALMKNPDAEALEECLNAYPYFQSARILYLIARNQQEGIFSKELLMITAVYAGERANLYSLITQKFNTAYDPEENLEVKIAQSPVKKQSTELIDKFLEQKPQITRPKAEFYNASEKAAKSIIEEEEFVSETLAGIYTRLKKYDKAINIYRKLSLIYPEKSNYFALLINNLENKIDE